MATVCGLPVAILDAFFAAGSATWEVSIVGSLDGKSSEAVSKWALSSSTELHHRMRRLHAAPGRHCRLKNIMDVIPELRQEVIHAMRHSSDRVVSIYFRGSNVDPKTRIPLFHKGP